MPRYRVTMAGKNYDAMADLVRKHRLNIAGHTGKKAGRGRYVVDAFADSDQIERLRSEGYHVDVHEDVEQAGKKRQAEAPFHPPYSEMKHTIQEITAALLQFCLRV